LCKHYVAIEQLRLGKRLTVEWQIGNYNPQQKIPSLMLQPLLENAIFHGIEPLASGGKITFKISQTKTHLSIVISNPYPLIKKTLSSDKNTAQDQEARHNRMALDNIRRRLTAHYGNNARLSSSAEQGLFTTYIFCPLNQ
jgi:two-component system, LytTR family, sensor histidine kinase AlgZ